jgi:Protein of unknown function (DUF1552)
VAGRVLWKRRELLASLGASAALAPFVPLLNASGQESTVPKRLVLYFTPHGTVWNNWRPTGSGTDFKLSRILASLAPVQKKIVVIDGLGVHDDGVGAPHTKGPALLWTASSLRDDGMFKRDDCSGGCTFGWNSGPSFDQVLAKRFAGTTKFNSYEFGVSSGGGQPGSHMIYSGDSKPVPPRQDPVAAWNELFADSVRPAAEVDALRTKRQLTIDLLNGELSQLETRVASADKPKVQAHREALHQLETQLLGPIVECTKPAKPNSAEKPKDQADAMPWTTDRQLELMVAAFTCDLTRIASFQFRPGENDGFPYRFLGVTDEHHLTSHDSGPDAQEKLTKIYTWYAERFAAFLMKLDAIPEGAGTMLDNTLVIWGSEVGTGWNHDFKNVPFIVAGGGANGVMGGQYLKVAKGTMHNRLIVSAMRYMGAMDVESFGTLDKEKGTLEGLGI